MKVWLLSKCHYITLLYIDFNTLPLRLFSVFFNILVESLRVVSGSVLTNAHGSINLNVGLFFQEQGSRIEFGCTFESRARDTFIQEGQVSQSIYSVNNCRAISSSHVLLGYYIHSPSIIAAGMCGRCF